MVGTVSTALPANTERDTTYPVVFTFTNNNATLPATGVKIIKSLPNFEETSDTCGSQIAAGGSCQIEGNFKPTSSGPVSLSAMLSYNEGADVKLLTNSETYDFVFPYDMPFELVKDKGAVSKKENATTAILVVNEKDKAGGIASANKIDFTSPFSIDADFDLGPGSGNGVGFLFTTANNKLTFDGGSGIGVRGLPGIVIRVDMYSGTNGIDIDDSKTWTYMPGNKTTHPVPANANGHIKIQWNPTTKELSYSISGGNFPQVINDRVKINDVQTYFDGGYSAYFMVTAATGGATSKMTVANIHFAAGF